jgi:hypothetical protein
MRAGIMITINLLPEEFRVKEKTQSKYPVKQIAMGAGVLFAVLTVFFYIDFVFANFSLKKLQKESADILPQQQQLKQLETEVEQTLKPENAFLNKFVTADRPLTHLFSWVSEQLPASSWLTEFKLSREGQGGRLFLKGLTLPTKEKSSIEWIEVYLHQLKAQMPDSNLSLTTSRQRVKGVEVTEFIANFDWGLTPGVPSK